MDFEQTFAEETSVIRIEAQEAARKDLFILKKGYAVTTK
jgi:hypothetical protein